MFLYQQRLERVEAVKLSRDNAVVVSEWCGGEISEQQDLLDPSISFLTLRIRGNGEVVSVGEGDYVVRDKEGRYKASPSSIFETMFESASS